MVDYKSLYHLLFNETTKAIETLQDAQRRAEEIYMDSGETDISWYKKNFSSDE